MGIIIVIAVIIGAIWLFKTFTSSDDEDVKPSNRNSKNDIDTPTRKEMKEHYNQSIDIASDIVNNKNQYVILDTETTGVGTDDVIIQIGIIDLDGNTLLNTLIKPTKKKRIDPGATEKNGITMDMLQGMPTFADIYPKFKEIIRDKKILIYNNTFDVRLIEQTCRQDKVSLEGFSTLCMMKLYAAYKNQWNDYHKEYKWPKLPEGDHSAVGDCIATLEVLTKIANGQKTEINDESWTHPDVLKDREENEKYWTFYRTNRDLFAKSKEMEKTDIDKSIEGYRKALDNLFDYRKSASSPNKNNDNLEIINRLTICLCKKGNRSEAKEEATKYFQNYPYDSEYAVYDEIMKRVNK